MLQQVFLERTQAYVEDLKNIMSGEDAASNEEWHSAIASLHEHETNVENRGTVQLSLTLNLLRYYKPEFDGLSLGDKLDLIKRAHDYTRDLSESLRKLQSFLEFGAPNRQLRPVVAEPHRAVEAAILHEVQDLKYPQIGRMLGIPPPPDYEVKRDYQGVSDAVKRGKDILEKAFGKEGWRERRRAMKAEMAWWRSLSPEEKFRETDLEFTALSLGISREEARRRAERRRS